VTRDVRAVPLKLALAGAGQLGGVRQPASRSANRVGGDVVATGLVEHEWEAAWSAEIDRRVREVDDGSAELLDGDEVLAEARAWLDAQRR
jgi:hypothetical protein